MNKIISIKELEFSYLNSIVLDNINISIYENDFLAIIGPNGGGKSTFLKLILGLLKIEKGTIKLELDKKDIAYVPQNTNLNLDFPITALDVVLMGHIGSNKRLFYSKEDIKCAKRSLDRVDMLDFSNIKIGDLSGGQRQRVFIARALCCSPKVILLDEPTANIDKLGQAYVYELLKKLNINMTIIVVSHDISVLLNYAKNVAHINRNLVYHTLENIQKNVYNKGEHLCEVELLSTLGFKR